MKCCRGKKRAVCQKIPELFKKEGKRGKKKNMVSRKKKKGNGRGRKGIFSQLEGRKKKGKVQDLRKGGKSEKRRPR